MDREEDRVVAEGVPERLRPIGVGQQGDEIAEADEGLLAGIVGGVEAQADRVDQRVDREDRLDEKGRSQEHDDVDRPSPSSDGGVCRHGNRRHP
jgi:hypothetical protein